MCIRFCVNTYFVQVRTNSGRVRQGRVVDDNLERAVGTALSATVSLVAVSCSLVSRGRFCLIRSSDFAGRGVARVAGYESLPLKLHAQPMVGRRDGRASVECKPHPVLEQATGTVHDESATRANRAAAPPPKHKWI